MDSDCWPTPRREKAINGLLRDKLKMKISAEKERHSVGEVRKLNYFLICCFVLHQFMINTVLCACWDQLETNLQTKLLSWDSNPWPCILERASAKQSSSLSPSFGVVSCRMCVRIPVMTLVPLNKALEHYCFLKSWDGSAFYFTSQASCHARASGFKFHSRGVSYK